MQIAIGKMKHKMTIEEKVVSSDGGGGVTEAWQAIANNPNVYVDIVEVTIAEQAKFSQILSDTTHKILTRYHTDLTLDKRLNDGTNIFEIKKIDNIKGENRFLLCYTRKL